MNMVTRSLTLYTSELGDKSGQTKSVFLPLKACLDEPPKVLPLG